MRRMTSLLVVDEPAENEVNVRALLFIGVYLAAIVALLSVASAQPYSLRAVVVDGGGTRLASSEYRAGVSVGQPVASFWLSGSGYKGMLGFWPYPYGDSVGVNESDAYIHRLPLVFSLAQVTPNPFGRRTAIRYGLPQASDVALRVYNSVGRVVTTLVQTRQSAGWYTVSWDISGVSAARLPCGTYFCRLEAGEFTATRKMVKSK